MWSSGYDNVYRNDSKEQAGNIMYPKDGSSVIFRNVGTFLPDYMAS
jgi:hypothetical protein